MEEHCYVTKRIKEKLALTVRSLSAMLHGDNYSTVPGTSASSRVRYKLRYYDVVPVGLLVSSYLILWPLRSKKSNYNLLVHYAENYDSPPGAFLSRLSWGVSLRSFSRIAAWPSLVQSAVSSLTFFCA